MITTPESCLTKLQRLGEQNRNSSSPKYVYFVNTITIIRKEDEPKETPILSPNAIESDDRNVAVKDEKTVEKKSKVSKIIVEKRESSDLGNINKASDLEDESELGEEWEWIEYEQPLDLVDVRDESVYDTLIEKMISCSLNYDFRNEKGDPSNLKIPCMIGNHGYEHRRLKFVGIGKDMHVFLGNMCQLWISLFLIMLKQILTPAYLK
uniref:Uncharacterized protein n=1 Tax=Tanacetum cinerariifolium TaxID=118510 RepID=A0A699HV11_TANCI|nr:hypothetical protein [Tanacetum cinerariifolium]